MAQTKEERKAYMQQWRLTHKERLSDYSKKYRAENLDRITKYNKVYCSQYREDNKEELKIKKKIHRDIYKEEINARLRNGQTRKYHLKKSYGISIETYDILYSEQNGKCLICDTYFKELCVDHCHIRLIVRGLLCKKCNSAIGMLNDNEDNLLRAIDYLKRDTGFGKNIQRQ